MAKTEFFNFAGDSQYNLGFNRALRQSSEIVSQKTKEFLDIASKQNALFRFDLNKKYLKTFIEN